MMSLTMTSYKPILIACEASGTVREVFRDLGFDAVSCDLLPTEIEGPHYQCGLEEAINEEDWGLIIAHPPCTYLTVTGNKWFYHPEDSHLHVGLRRAHPKFPNRQEDKEEAIKFFMMIANHPCEKICIEKL